MVRLKPGQDACRMEVMFAAKKEDFIATAVVFHADSACVFLFSPIDGPRV